MDDQNKDLEQAGIIPPNPDNELPAPAEIVKPEQPAVAPVNTTPSPTPPVTAAADKKLEDMLGEAEKQMASTPATPIKQPRKRKRWLIWLVLLIIVIGGAAAWYFLYRLPQQRAFEPETVTDQTSATIIYRASTFPTATLTIQNNAATLSTKLLNPISETPYVLVLANSQDGLPKQLPQIGNDQAIQLGDFDIDASGKVVISSGENGSFTVPDSIANYDTAVVMISNGDEASIVMSGKLYQDEQNTTKTLAKLAFPVDLSQLTGNMQVKTLAGKTNPAIEISFNQLPDLADLGYTYEAHLVKFEGPYVTQDKAIGRFPGNKLGVDISLPAQTKLTDFTNLVISLEPLWDNNQEISQMKPFIAEL